MKLFGKWQKEEKKATPEKSAFGTEATGESVESAVFAQQTVGQNRKILVVDDNQVVLKAFDLKLKALGFQVLTADDGGSAVSVARQERPDLIVLDINFPPDVGSSGLQWDGFTIMQWMQRFQELADTPVIIITAGDPDKFKARAIAAGAVAFFQKPINHEDFLMAVRRTLSKPRAEKAKTA